jgi:hypothetical protein
MPSPKVTVVKGIKRRQEPHREACSWLLEVHKIRRPEKRSSRSAPGAVRGSKRLKLEIEAVSEQTKPIEYQNR